MKTGYIISGIAHLLLILWLLFGGLILRDRDEPLLNVAEVSIVSAEEFAALSAQPQPEAPSLAPEITAAPPPRPAPPVPEPEPEPEPEPIPEPPAVPPTPEAVPDDQPTPPEADRVAPEPAPAPEPEAVPGPEVIDDTTPADTPTDQPVEELPPTAPEEATTEIVTEAETPSSAPVTSIRPQARPDRPRPPVETAEPAPQPDPEPAPDLTDAIDSAVDDALADILNDTATPAPDPSPVPSGPPLTRGEKDGLRVAVSQCWNLGSSSTDAMATTVVVLVSMSRGGQPDAIRLVSSDGPNQTAINTAFEAARRAIIRCGANGYNLPSDKYEQWREIEMTFNPENMRIK
ncbi:energy transducer TonB [Maritimibacter fusiformis]|uniref:Energy transducer TonB n=1 Tax=Maritimibacter fusiformis TaxID=2603819 RepID=A0A5D0RKA3_9RHOB|nr:energy transducer TonB [Maritimibacter fusiformis]TYB80944.1 energy transducer TonB [Maritimibacter fusiformis]